MKGFWIFLFCFSTTLVYGQKDFRSGNKQAQKFYEQARFSLSAKVYDQALEELKSAIKLDPNFVAAYQQTADVNRILQRYETAVQNYRKVLELDPEFHPLTFIGLAESLLFSGKYQEAIPQFKKYAAFPGVPEEGKKRAAKLIVDCEFSIEALKKPVPFNPVNLGPSINSDKEEYLPVVTADEETIIFTRMAGNNEDFYTSAKKDAKWTKSMYLSPSINTSIYNEGAQCISPDGMYLFFTGCNRPEGKGRCDIYVCKREGKDWSKPFNLGTPINTPGWESQPSISADGRTLYFVSTRPGGLGGYDIWKTELGPNGSWSEPQNLGPSVNTPYDEISPFIHHDSNTLYFASNGWPGLGNKDLFMSRVDQSGSFTKPVNLGYPINTPGEESGLTVSSNGKTAFFASDMKGGQGGMDIYSFEVPQAVRPGAVTYVKGKVFDAKTQEPLDANIKITALKTNAIAFEDVSDFESGEFLAVMQAGKSFGLSVDKKGYLFYSENFSLDKPNAAAKPYLLSVGLQKIEVGGLVTLNNIFFATNKFELLPESKTELQQLISFLNLNPTVSIEIDGHTDDVGDDKINQVLSENRAKTVYNYLVDSKIATSRLSFKGYGESKPVTANTSAEGRQQNRRTEFRIVKR
ncbi:OmpA family protein [Paradesertivirga mongoliensis]|uniref:OmpA family protein n=1 Tax=Paradesertivirga mongoliensis TaxID=2100740 RepID=A0ABW4ZPB3_9SPHI|nr:OmpA family protein [Pedobacter mongoliensis]